MVVLGVGTRQLTEYSGVLSFEARSEHLTVDPWRR